MTVKLRSLHDVTREMMEADSKPELFRTVTTAASELLGFEYNTVRRYDREAQQLVPVAVSPALRDESGDRSVYERGDTIHWEAIDEGEILVFQTVEEIDDDVERSGDGSMIDVPLAGYGVLAMGAPEPQIINESDIELARVFGANIETAIERVERLETLRERETELAEKNDRLEQFAGTLTHELRNPLNVLAGRIDLARETGDPEHFDELDRSIDRMNRLIDDLLSFTREGDVEVEPELLDLSETAMRSWESVRSPDATLVAETDVSVRADPDRLRQLLDNLFRNAIEHAASETEGDLTVTVGELPDGFAVADDGPGIPADRRSQLVDGEMTELPHWSGLGLRVVSEVADAHGWSLAVTETEEGGASFEFHGVEHC